MLPAEQSVQTDNSTDANVIFLHTKAGSLGIKIFKENFMVFNKIHGVGFGATLIGLKDSCNYLFICTSNITSLPNP